MTSNSPIALKLYRKWMSPSASAITSQSNIAGNGRDKTVSPSNSDAAMAAAPSTAPATSPAATTSLISKSESRMLLKSLWTCTDVLMARILVAPIMERYMHLGKGLYPIAAARAISRLPGGLKDAVNILISVMLRISVSLSSNPQVLWQSLRKGAGAASGAFKTVDSSLSLIIAEHWLCLINRGAEAEWDPLPLFDGITALWGAILRHAPPPPAKPTGSKHGMPHILEDGKPQIFKLCRHILYHAHMRRVATIKARNVAGHLLPKELVRMIADAVYDSAPSLKVLRNFKSYQSEGHKVVGVRTFKRSYPVDGPEPSLESSVLWHVGFVVQRPRA